MTAGREQAIETGRWLAEQRAKRLHRGKPLSTITLARLANAYIAVQKLPVKNLHQQEISALENSTLDRGPKRPQPWWAVLRDFIESGALDEMLQAYEGPLTEADADVVVDFWEEKAKRGETPVRSTDGEVVGRIVWTRKL